MVAAAAAVAAVTAVTTKLPDENSQPSSSLVWFGMCNNVSEACTHRKVNVVVVAVAII